MCASLSGIFFIYTFGKPLISDSKWSIPASVSLIREHNYDINEYQFSLKKYNYKDTLFAKDKLYPIPSAGVSLAAVPFVFVYYQFVDLKGYAEPEDFTAIEHLVAAFYVVLTALFVYLICRQLLDQETYAVLLTFIFAFCTTAWSTASLALFQHGPSMLFIAIAVYLLLKARLRPSLVQYAGLSLAFSFVVRPSNIIPLALIALFVALEYRQYLWRFLALAALIIVPFLIFDYSSYGAFLPPYYTAAVGQTNSSPGYILTGLTGTLISPARGLFVFSPVLIFSIVGGIIKFRKKEFLRLDYFLLLIILAHWFCISMFNPWWGGHSYGPRYFTDMLPLMIYFMVPAVSWLAGLKSVKYAVVLSLMMVLIGISFYANLQGTTSDPARQWNVHPEIFDNQGRLWNWSDIPYLRSDFEDHLENEETPW